MTAKLTIAAALVGLSVLTAPSSGLAQEPSALTAETVTDTQISAFVRAAIALEEIRKDFTIRIAAAPDDEARAALAAEADETARKLVEKVQGITPDEYLMLSRLSLEDETVNKRVGAEIERMRTQKSEFEKQKAEEQLQFSTPQPE